MDISKLKPMGKRVLIQIHKVENVKGGLLLVQQQETPYKQANVIAVGNVEGLNVGDVVLIYSYMPNQIEDEVTKEFYCLISEDDILGVF